MITREQIRELAEVESPEGAAVSFYFQPTRPHNRSHKEEIILLKDLVRGAMKQAHGAARSDLQRILENAEQLHANHAQAHAIFACSAKGVWREFNLPPKLEASAVVLNSRFHLSPLVRALEHALRAAVALVDREKAHIFAVNNSKGSEEVTTLEQIVSDTPRRVRSDGFGGYQAGHVERHIDNEAMRHFKHTAERLKDIVETRGLEQVVIGCRDETWSEIEPHLHTYVRQRLAGRFSADPASSSVPEVREQVERIILQQRASEREALVREVVGEAHRDGRGVTGLRADLLNAGVSAGREQGRAGRALVVGARGRRRGVSTELVELAIARRGARRRSLDRADGLRGRPAGHSRTAGEQQAVGSRQQAVSSSKTPSGVRRPSQIS